MTRFASVLAAILLVVAALPARADEASDIAAIAAQRAALGKAYEDGDAAALRALMTPDQRSVTFPYDGPVDVDQQVATLKDLDVEVYDAIPAKVDLLGPGSALVTTEQSYRGSFKGNPLPGRVFVSEVWVKVGDTWLQKFYQETIIEVEE